MLKNKKGFTLIELLFVIAIIGLLSTLAIISLRSARIEARDAKRRADIATLQSGLNVYFDQNDKYPSNGCVWDPLFGAFLCIADQATPWWVPDLRGYMSPPPADPGGHQDPTFDVYIYFPSELADPKSYNLLFMLEKGPQEDNCGLGPVRIGGIAGGSFNLWSTRCPD